MPTPLNKALYERVKSEAKSRFKNWPSAYASGWLVKEYKRRGGRYKGNKPGGVGRWFKEKWVNACSWPRRVPCGRKSMKRAFPYCRPSVRVTKRTPKTVHEMTKSKIRKMCKRKRRDSKKRMPSQSRRASLSRRRSRSRKCVRLTRSTNPKKKFKVQIPGKCIVQFGGRGYSDYTKHKDKERMGRYVSRHKKRENWTRSGMCTAGFWSKHLLWNKPGLEMSKKSIEKRFNLKFCKN